MKNSDILKVLKNSGHSNIGINTIKYYTNLKEMNKTFDYIYNLPYYKKLLINKPFPESIEELPNKITIFKHSKLNHELLWSSIIISKFHQEINSFLVLKDKFTKNLLLSNYEMAMENLEEIEKDFGVSLWLIENKISLLQLKDGLEAQKEYSKEITENEAVVMTIRYIARYFSIKAEKNVTPQKYNKEIHILKAELDSNDFYHQYLNYKINIATVDKFEYTYFLQIDNTLSIIDRYYSLIDILIRISFQEEYDLDIKIYEQIYVNLQVINDEKMHNFFFNMFPTSCDISYIDNRIDILEIYDDYTLGQYENVINKSEKMLLREPFKMDILEVYVKSLVDCKKESSIKGNLLGEVIKNLSDLYISKSDTNKAYNNLIKNAYMFSIDYWGKQLRSIAIAAFFDTTNEILNSYIHIGVSLASLSKPKFLDLFLNGKSGDIIQQLQSRFQSETLMLQEAFFEKDYCKIEKLYIPNRRKIKYLADLYFSQKCFSEALNLYNELLNESNLNYKIDIIAKVISCLVYLDSSEEALDLLVNCYFENNNIIYRANVNALIDGNISLLDKKNINIPIIYHLYTISISDDKEGARNDAFEDYVEAWKVKSPSELDVQKFNKEKIIYFLENICTINVMASSIFFETQSDVENERLNICQKLLLINEPESEKYTKEIKNITEKKMIRKGIREIESSKIYVDIEGIKNSLQKSIQESFIRYKSFDFDLENSNPNYILIDEETNLMLPSNEKWNLFSTMVLEIRDSFVSSKEYGLDGYLSVGIRHGTLSGQLRGKIESEHLITPKKSSVDEYQDNEYWIEKLGIYDSDKKKFIFERLNDFSAKIDHLINELKNELIQINIDNSKNLNGLFDYMISNVDLEYLNKITASIDDYNDFFDAIINFLWNRTDENLTKVNHFLQNTFKVNMNSCFEILQYDIDCLKDSINITYLANTIVRLKTEMQYEIDKISYWFTKKDTAEQKDYTINLPIEIGIEMANNIYRNLNGYELIKKNIEGIELKGKTFKALVDICFIIFENIFNHSFINEKQKIEINTYVKGENLVLECINEVSKEIDIKKQNELMLDKKKAITKNAGLEMVNKEGGSGFYKIFKIVTVDLKCELNIDFGFLDDHRFFIKLLISKGGLIN